MVVRLNEALELLSTQVCIPYAGGTDLMVKEHHAAPFLYLHDIPELKTLSEHDGVLHLGAALTYSELLNAPQTPAILKEALAQIAAPAIRNTATLGGNIANASPKGDGALVCAVADATLVLQSVSGERRLSMEEFILGRNKTALRPDELLVEIQMPTTHLANYSFCKVGGRKALAISRVSFAGLISIDTNTVRHLALAFGAVEDTVVCPRELAALLIGRSIEEARSLVPHYLEMLDKRIQPIRGRVSAEYRKQVCLNLAGEFLYSRLEG